MNKPPILQAALAAIICIIFWSSAYVGIRIGLTGYDPEALGLFRYGLAACIMLIVYCCLPNKTKPSLQDLLIFWFTGGIGIALYNISLNIGEQQVTAAAAGFVISLVPVVTALLAVWVFKERISPWGYGGLLLGIAGLLLIFWSKSPKHFHFNSGLLHICLSVLCGATYVLMQKILTRKFHPLEVASWCIFFAAISSLIYAPHLWRDWHHSNWHATLAACYLGIFPAALAYTCWSYALKYIPVTKVASGLFLAPICTAILGWLILGEIPAMLAVWGGLLTIMAAGLMLIRVKKND